MANKNGNKQTKNFAKQDANKKMTDKKPQVPPTKEQPKVEPKVEPKEQPKVEAKEQPKVEAKVEPKVFVAKSTPAKVDNPRPVPTDEFGNEIDPSTLTPDERVRIQRANAELQAKKNA
jgi:hypothetical protein